MLSANCSWLPLQARCVAQTFPCRLPKPAVPAAKRSEESCPVRPCRPERTQVPCWMRVVEAVRLDCVRAGDDLEAIVVPCVAGGGDARRELVGLEHFRAFEVPAALREDLVLELDRGGARSLVATYGAHDIGGAAEAGVAIDDERERGGFGESKDVVDHVALRDQPDVGQSEVRERASGAGDVRGRVPGQLDGTRGEPVEDSWRDDQPGPAFDRHEMNPLPYLPPTIKAAFLSPGTITMHCDFSSSS